jgi:hypothetical protein
MVPRIFVCELKQPTFWLFEAVLSMRRDHSIALARAAALEPAFMGIKLFEDIANKPGF